MSCYSRAAQRVKCRNTCRHEPCEGNGPPVTVREATLYCQCLGEVTAASLLREDVFETSVALTVIMGFARIPDLKAMAAADVIMYHFLHYEQKCQCHSMKPKKFLRLEELRHDLKPLVGSWEAIMLCIELIAIGFKAFYYEPKSPDVSPDYPDYYATKRMTKAFTNFYSLSDEEANVMEARIGLVLRHLSEGIKRRHDRIDCADCNCCYCAKKRGYYIAGKSPPGRIVEKKKRKPCRVCPKKKLTTAKMEVKRPAEMKYDFSVDWIKSIWDRPDFEYYYQKKIDENRRDATDSGAEEEEQKEGGVAEAIEEVAETVAILAEFPAPVDLVTAEEEAPIPGEETTAAEEPIDEELRAEQPVAEEPATETPIEGAESPEPAAEVAENESPPEQ